MNRYAIDLIIQNKEAERVATEATIPRKTLMTSFTRKESSASSMMKVSNRHRLSKRFKDKLDLLEIGLKIK